jgi:glyoxylase-like metal-dependent hydrolase (beta-lactamase superfamily II)
MSGADQVFSNNVEINSLALAHSGAKIAPFTVDRWLQDGDTIALAAESEPEHVLRVLTIPGHTPDSIALYLSADQRLFIGDILCACT